MKTFSPHKSIIIRGLRLNFVTVLFLFLFQKGVKLLVLVIHTHCRGAKGLGWKSNALMSGMSPYSRSLSVLYSISSPTVLHLSPFDSATPWRHTLSRGAALVFLSLKTPLWPLTPRCQCPGSVHDLCSHCLTPGHTVPFPVRLKKAGGRTAQMAGAELMKVTRRAKIIYGG